MPKYASVFSGAGGLDIGLERAGWTCLYATDYDPFAVQALEANRGTKLKRGRRFMPEAIIQQADIRALKGRDVLARCGARRGDLDLLAGGPPCQSWSSAGHQRGFEDPRGKLFDDYLRIAADLDPRWLVFENVRGLLTARGPDGAPGSALAHMRRRLLAKGWQTRVDLLNAADFGVPQRRVRLILLGFRDGDHPTFPTPTHATEVFAAERTWVSLAECLSGVAPPSADEIIRPTGKMAMELANLPPGTGAKSPGKAETTRPGGHWGYKQGAFIADPLLPARTVTASAQQDWLRDPVVGLRRLCPRECAAIQTFPAGWVLPGKRADQYRLVGNAVPPLLADRLGATLLAHIKKAPEVRASGGKLLQPLPDRLEKAIRYTQREHDRNGESRRLANKRAPRLLSA